MTTIVDPTSAGWAQFNGSPTQAPTYSADTVREDGTSSVLVVADNTGAKQSTIYKPITYNFNSEDIIGFWAHVPNWMMYNGFATQVNTSVVLSLHQSGSYNVDYVHFSAFELMIGWNLVVINKDDFTPHGSFAWENDVTGVTLKLNNTGGGQQQTIHVNQLFSGLESEVNAVPRCILRTDDGQISNLTIAEPILSAKDFQPIAAIVKANTIAADDSGATSVLSSAQLSTLQSKKWLLVNHGDSGANINTFASTALMTAEVNAGQRPSPGVDDWLDGPQVYVYPEGGTGSATYPNRECLTAVIAGDGMDAAWATNGALIQEHRGLLPDTENLPAWFIDGKTVAQVTAQIDKAILLKSTLCLGFHNLLSTNNPGGVGAPPPSVATDYYKDDFEAIINYLDAAEISVVHPGEWGATHGLWAYSTEQSNLLTDVFATPDYIDSLVLSNQQPTAIDADYSTNITSGSVYWAVWEKDSVPAVVDLAAIQAAVGAADSGSATITATGAQTTITPTVADTEAESYRFYIAWKSGADESLVYSVSFGASGRSMADDYFQARRTYFSPRRRVARAPRKQRPPIPRIY